MKYPLNRPRRLRKNPAMRHLYAENALTTCKLIQPIFITCEKKLATPIEQMPGITRIYIDDLLKVVQKIHDQGILGIALFPVIDQQHKTPLGEYAYHPDGLIPQAIQCLATKLPDMNIMLDIALDPFTTHGQDGVLNNAGVVDNDKTIQALVKQALLYAKAGAKVLAPSDMMDGRIGAIRQALEQNGYHDVVLISYAVKYASTLYGPFRHAVASNNLLTGDKKSYQMDYRNSKEALLEAQLDIDEGADMIIVKPGLHYLDVIYKLSQQYPAIPVLGYHVSAEYSMLKAFCTQFKTNETALVKETLTAFIRAGARGVITYYADAIANQL